MADQQNQMQPYQEPPMVMPDPFMGYGMQGLPPIPATSNNSQMIHELLSDDHVPENIKEDFFFVFARDNSLTFLDDLRKQSKLLALDIIKIDKMNATPYYDWDFNDEMNWSIMRNAFETKLDRSLGITGNVKNERTVQQSQFTESRAFAQSQQGTMDQSKDSILKRILGRR